MDIVSYAGWVPQFQQMYTESFMWMNNKKQEFISKWCDHTDLFATTIFNLISAPGS